MLFSDTYKEIKKPSKGLYKEKGSKFISYAFPVHSEEQVKQRIDDVKKIENSARHHCYAFILNPDKSAIRSNDDGEPSSTAGKPILGRIESNDLTNTLIIVARYFGGIKLGIPGLIRSYKAAAEDSLLNNKVIQKNIKEIYELEFMYENINNVMSIIKTENIDVITTDLKLDCKIIVSISRKDAERIINLFKNNYKINTKYLKTI